MKFASRSAGLLVRGMLRFGASRFEDPSCEGEILEAKILDCEFGPNAHRHLAKKERSARHIGLRRSLKRSAQKVSVQLRHLHSPID